MNSKCRLSVSLWEDAVPSFLFLWENISQLNWWFESMKSVKSSLSLRLPTFLWSFLHNTTPQIMINSSYSFCSCTETVQESTLASCEFSRQCVSVFTHWLNRTLEFELLKLVEWGLFKVWTDICVLAYSSSTWCLEKFRVWQTAKDYWRPCVHFGQFHVAW